MSSGSWGENRWTGKNNKLVLPVRLALGIFCTLFAVLPAGIIKLRPSNSCSVHPSCIYVERHTLLFFSATLSCILAKKKAFLYKRKHFVVHASTNRFNHLIRFRQHPLFLFRPKFPAVPNITLPSNALSLDFLKKKYVQYIYVLQKIRKGAPPL